MVFHVYVDGVTGTAPDAAWTVSIAMSAQYGVTAADAYARLTAGAFCVRANVDRATAERFARDLREMGARVRIEPADASPGEPRSTRPSDPPSDRSADRTTRSALPPQPEAGRAARPSLLQMGTQPGIKSALPPQSEAGRAARPSLLQMGTQPGTKPKPTTSALSGPIAVARTRSMLPDAPAQVEQALGALNGGELSLSMLDNAPPPARTTAPIPTAPRPSAPTPGDVPVDLFAPPSSSDDELAVELAIDEPAIARVATPAISRATTAPRPGAPAVTSLDADVAAASSAIAAVRAQSIAQTAGMPAPTPVIAAGSAPIASPISSPSFLLRESHRLMSQPRVRLAAGVLLAILLGFVPASFFASSRELSTLHPIDQQVLATQAAADTPEAYQTLDTYRAAQLATKRGKYHWIIIEAMLIWAATSGALGYVWFRQIRWPTQPA